jgi:hypothetical protein
VSQPKEVSASYHVFWGDLVVDGSRGGVDDFAVRFFGVEGEAP